MVQSFPAPAEPHAKNVEPHAKSAKNAKDSLLDNSTPSTLMNALVVAIHGILTNQTDASWPDRFDAWMYRHDPSLKVLKKEYAAGPFPRWNCWVKDPLLARSLANELELFFETEANRLKAGTGPSVWFVAHSNGAVIALLTARRLLARGYRLGGLILTGAACEADVEKSGVLEWCQKGLLGTAIAYCSADDEVLNGDARFGRGIRAWLWGRLMWPYGCLGRTGWLPRSAESRGADFPVCLLPSARTADIPAGLPPAPTPPFAIFTRWFAGGHCAYFKPENIEATFEQIYQDISQHTPTLC